MAGASLTNGVGSVEQLDGDEPDLAFADVLEIMDQRLVSRVIIVPSAVRWRPVPPSTTVQKYRRVCAWNGPRSPGCSRTSQTRMLSFSSHSLVPTSRLRGAASSSAAYSARSNVPSLRMVAATVASLGVRLRSVSRLVQAEDEPGVTWAERAGELRAVADLAG